MKMELSQKDIRLIVTLLAVVVAVVGIRLFILPGIDAWNAAKAEHEEMEATKQEMIQQMDFVNPLEGEIENLTQMYLDKSVEYYDYLENREIDSLVTGIVLKNKLFPVTLSIGEMENGVPERYKYAESKEEIKQNGAELGQVKVKLSMTGTHADVMRFVDSIAADYPAIRIEDINLNTATYLDANMQPMEQDSTDCVLIIYMCNKKL